MQQRQKILIVEDEVKLIEVIQSYLENEDYIVESALNGNRALSLFDSFKPDLVVLDLMLPDFSGEEICKIIRQHSRTPIIMLTAKSEEESIINGLNIGADDYITKPFSPRQLVARVKTVLRRTKESLGHETALVFNKGDLVLLVESHEVQKNGSFVSLTPVEFELLVRMAKYPKKVFTREELIAFAMGNDYEGNDRTIDTHIKNLRQKIETNPKEPEYILTVYGIGYKFGGE